MKNNPTIRFENFSLWVNNTIRLSDLNFSITPCKITSIIGPSFTGKTDVLKAVNRLSEINPNAKIEGKIYFDEKNIYDEPDVYSLRKKIAYITSEPMLIPGSIYDNLVLGMEINNYPKERYKNIIKIVSERVGIWSEIENILKSKAESVSMITGLKISLARALALNPHTILLDNPIHYLDTPSATIFLDLLMRLKRQYTIVIVTQELRHAAKTSDFTIFMKNGKIIEYDRTQKLFSNPASEETEEFLMGKM